MLGITVLNVYRPVGLTSYGWHKQRLQRQVQQRSARPTMSTLPTTPFGTGEARRRLRFGAVSAGLGYFVLHFAEMWFAMMLGMMAFVVVRLGTTAQGYTALLDVTSIDSQAWMGLFMAAPMLAWMRVRGCTWRDCVEMSGAMLLPALAGLVLGGVGAADLLSSFSNLQHIAMVVTMLAVMLYRRENYTSGYSFGRLSAGAAGRRSAAAIEPARR